MRRLFTGVSLFAVLFATVASLHAQAPPTASPTPISQQFTSQEGRFSVLIAGTPKTDSQTIFLGGKDASTATAVDKTTLNQFWVELENNNISYMIMYNDYTGTYGTGDPQTVLAGTRNGAVSGKTLLTDTAISLNGVPGRAFTATDGTWNFSVRQFLKGQRLYQLIVVSNAAHPATLTDQFMNSFQIW